MSILCSRLNVRIVCKQLQVVLNQCFLLFFLFYRRICLSQWQYRRWIQVMGFFYPFMTRTRTWSTCVERYEEWEHRFTQMVKLLSMHFWFVCLNWIIFWFSGGLHHPVFWSDRRIPVCSLPQLIQQQGASERGRLSK